MGWWITIMNHHQLVINGLVVGVIFLFGINAISSSATSCIKNYSDLPIFKGKTIYVDDDNIDGPWDGTSAHPYRFIQDGVDAAYDNDIVFVRTGIYSKIVGIHKQLHLVGENKTNTIISNNIDVVSDGVNISGFTFENNFRSIGIGYQDNNSLNFSIYNNMFINCNSFSIWFISGDNAIISHNVFLNGDTAIFIHASNDIKIRNNRFINYKNAGISARGSNNLVIEDNFFENNAIAIHSGPFFTSVTSIRIMGNIINNNGRGVDLCRSYKSVITDNVFCDNKYGLVLGSDLGSYSRYNSIMNNTFENNIRHAWFENSFGNQWDSNYWDKPRRVPYFIFGYLKKGILIKIPWINIDRHPRDSPVYHLSDGGMI
jgi:parallel beta-helix repeat protein